jgi:hypothetical protein
MSEGPDTVGEVGSLALVLSLIAPIVLLAPVGVVSWRRAAPYRLGTALAIAQGPRVPARRRTSRTTYLALTGGVVVAGGGIVRGPPLGWLGLAFGAFVAGAGGLLRVRSLSANLEELEVDRPVRPRRLPWAAIRGVDPPRWPLGGWRLLADDGPVTLMPSDLLGNEWVLAEAIRRCSLVWSDGAWRSRAASHP